jgi:hypothetical protein
VLEQSLLDIVVENGHFTKMFSRAMNKLSTGQETLFVHQILYCLGCYSPFDL